MDTLQTGTKYGKFEAPTGQYCARQMYIPREDLAAKDSSKTHRRVLDNLRAEGAPEPHIAGTRTTSDRRLLSRGDRGRDWRALTATRDPLSASLARQSDDDDAPHEQLRSLLKFLKRNGQGPDAELPSTTGVRKPNRPPKALTLQELAALLNAPDLAKPEGVRDRALMELVYGAGLRVTEAVELRMEELDLDTAAFRVTGKRGKTRWLPLPLHDPWLESIGRGETEVVRIRCAGLVEPRGKAVAPNASWSCRSTRTPRVKKKPARTYGAQYACLIKGGGPARGAEPRALSPSARRGLHAVRYGAGQSSNASAPARLRLVSTRVTDGRLPS